MPIIPPAANTWKWILKWNNENQNLVHIVNKNVAIVFSNTRCLLLCVMCLYIVVCPFVRFLLTIVLSVLLRFTDSDYPFGIFKLLVSMTRISNNHHQVRSKSERLESQAILKMGTYKYDSHIADCLVYLYQDIVIINSNSHLRGKCELISGNTKNSQLRM